MIAVLNRILNCSRLPILVGLLLSLLLALIILRGVLFAPGLMGFRDIGISFDLSTWRDGLWYCWSGGSDTAHVTFLYPFALLSYLFDDSGSFVKFLYFFIFTLISFISFSTAYYYLKGKSYGPRSAYLGAFIASLIYTLNPFTIMHFVHYHGLFAYAFFPLLLYFTPVAVRQVSIRGVLKYAIILGLILLMTTTWYTMFFIGAFLVFFFGCGELVLRIISERRKAWIHIPYIALLAALTICFFCLLFSYYLLPYRIGWTPNVDDLRLYITNPVDLITRSGAGLESVIRIFAGEAPEMQSIYDSTGFLRGIWTISIWLVPILVLSIIIRKPRDREVIVLTLLAIVGIFITKGAAEPFGNWYLWAFFKFEGVLNAAGFHSPTRAMVIICLAYAFLGAIAVAEFSGRGRTGKLWRHHISTTVLLIFICIFICVSAFPLLSGDYRGAAKPWDMPDPYKQMNEWLGEQEGVYQVTLLPEGGAVEWNPLRDSADPKAGAVSYFGRRLISDEAGEVSGMRCPEAQRYGSMIAGLLGDNEQISYSGKLYGAGNCKYIIFHDDTLPEGLDSERLLEDLSLQEDLSLVYVSDYIYIYENDDYQPYLHTEDKGILVVGGLDASSLLAECDLPIPGNRSFIFLEQNPGGDISSESKFQLADYLLFYGEKDMDDLVLSSIDGQYYFPALRYWGDDYNSPWQRSLFYSNTWPGILPSRQGSVYDFDLNLGATYTSEPGAELNFTLNTDDDNYELWIRNLISADGGGLEAYVDNQEIPEEINSYSAILQGFKWQKIGQMDLSQGEHQIKVKTKEGWEMVNTLAVIPQSTLEQYRKDVNQWLEDKDIKIIYLTDLDLMSEITKKPPVSQFVFDVVGEQKYVIGILGSGSFNIKVDDTNSYAFTGDNVEWRYCGPLILSQGEHNIVAGGKNIQDIVIYPVDSDSETLAEVFSSDLQSKVIDYEVINPTYTKVSVEITEPCILSFGESIHSQWIAMDEAGNKLPKVSLSSIANGFLVEEPGTYTITMEFAVQKYYTMGKIISGITLGVLLIVLALIIYSERRMRKGGKSEDNSKGAGSVNHSRRLSISWRMVSLVLLLGVLFVVSRLVPFPASWPVHFLFTFILTLLVYKALLNSKHTGAFLGAIILLMISWEVFEWIFKIGVGDNMFLYGLDTTMDLIAGLLGTIIGIWRSQPPKVD